MITLLITDRERGDDGDGVAMAPNYYRVIIDDEGRVRVFELTSCSRTWDWVWTPIEDGDLDIEYEIKAEALDRIVRHHHKWGDVEPGTRLEEEATDRTAVSAGADSVCQHCAGYTECDTKPLRAGGIWVHHGSDPGSARVEVCAATRIREAVEQSTVSGEDWSRDPYFNAPIRMGEGS
ncbi:MAG: hypothetical protein RL885_11580 [Planctomycetota bacterium]